jgi:coproporphyrinogen III oxidase
MKIELKKKLSKEWFIKLQNIICKSIEQLEMDYGYNIKFKKNKWKHGEFRTINGKVFEKGGVAFSNVKGKFSKEFAKKIPGTDKNKNFWSSGVSVVLHPMNPKIPSFHFNTRFICTEKNWFGGGMDATPCLKDDKEKKYFHKELKKICDLHDKNFYSKYKIWCDKYFYLPHRNESRGIGGIFFDYKMNEWEKDFSFIKDAGNTFVDILKTITRKKMFKKWTKKEKEIQLIKRGRYVEFNLLYDRGTKFGLNSGGNTKAILMSMPPSARWE